MQIAFFVSDVFIYCAFSSSKLESPVASHFWISSSFFDAKYKRAPVLRPSRSCSERISGANGVFDTLLEQRDVQSIC